VYARMHTLETTPEQYERGFEIVKHELLPWTRESTGFRGLIGLLDRENGRTLVLTFWSDEDSLKQSASAGDELSRRTAAAIGATRRSLDDFEVTLFDVVPDPDVQATTR
jgi:heme-degrading monooxygenase HmoA